MGSHNFARVTKRNFIKNIREILNPESNPSLSVFNTYNSRKNYIGYELKTIFLWTSEWACLPPTPFRPRLIFVHVAKTLCFAQQKKSTTYYYYKIYCKAKKSIEN
jgi:hypothetical protein